MSKLGRGVVPSYVQKAKTVNSNNMNMFKYHVTLNFLLWIDILALCDLKHGFYADSSL